MKERINEYLMQNKTIDFKDLLFSLIDERKLTDSEVYKRAGIDRKTFSKIRCIDHYIPHKNNVIKLCLSLSLSLEETTELLSSAGYQLSTNNNFDLIVRYFIERGIYDFDLINDYLDSFAGSVLEW